MPDMTLRAPNPFLRGRPAAPASPPAQKYEEEKGKPQRMAPGRWYGRTAPAPPSVVEPLPVVTVEMPEAQRQSAVAERIRELNRDLPDGVRYEPFDADTLRSLRQNAATPMPPMPEPPVSPIPPTPFSEQTHGLLERLIQDERNSAIFYAHMAEAAPSGDTRDALLNIADGCGRRQKTYGEMYERQTGKRFTPKEVRINTGIPFASGMALAVSEEMKAVQLLTDWLDNAPDNVTAANIQNIINKKMAAFNLLSLINSNNPL